MTSVAEVVKRKAWEEVDTKRKAQEFHKAEKKRSEQDKHKNPKKIIEEVLRYIETNKQDIINSFDSKGTNVLNLDLLDIYCSVICNTTINFPRISARELKKYSYRLLDQFYHSMLPYINKKIPIAGEEFENCYLVFEKRSYFYSGNEYGYGAKDTFIVEAKIQYKKPNRCSIM